MSCCRLVRGDEPAWSPDGTQILFSDEAIRVMQSNGWNERVVVPRDFLEPGNFLFRPAWSADGQQIAFVRHDGAWLWPVEIFVARLDGSRPTPLMPFPEEGFYYAHWPPAWSRDGRSLAFIHDFALTTSPAGSTQFRFLSVRAAYESKLDRSPDGDQLLFSDYSGDKSLRRPPFHGRLRVYSAFVSTGEVRQLIPEDGSPANPDYWDNNAVWSRGQP